MLKRIFRKTFLYSHYRKYKNKLDYIEIQKRLSNDTLLKDLKGDELAQWTIRIETALASADNQKINCVPEAGTLRDKLLVMHNGIVIEPLSYYGFPLLKLLMVNRGIHEPQEEYVFQEVLKEMPKGATMVELGAYWSFYSMWFNKVVSDANNYMVEPGDMTSGILNFKLNKLHGKFYRYFIAEKPSTNPIGPSTTSVDSFTEKNKIDFVDILHSDIQGNELVMLLGARNLISKRKVGYIFISTHTDQLHNDCRKFLDDEGFVQVCSADMQETFSHDGLLVYKNPEYKGVDKLEISLRGKIDQRFVKRKTNLSPFTPGNYT